MNETITAKKVVMHPFFSLVCFLSLLFILPRFGGIALMVGCASVKSVYVAVVPEQFQTQNGSLKSATCLVSAMWVGAAIITALILMGEIQV